MKKTIIRLMAAVAMISIIIGSLSTAVIYSIYCGDLTYVLTATLMVSVMINIYYIIVRPFINGDFTRKFLERRFRRALRQILVKYKTHYHICEHERQIYIRVFNVPTFYKKDLKDKIRNLEHSTFKDVEYFTSIYIYDENETKQYCSDTMKEFTDHTVMYITIEGKK